MLRGVHAGRAVHRARRVARQRSALDRRRRAADPFPDLTAARARRSSHLLAAQRTDAAIADRARPVGRRPCATTCPRSSPSSRCPIARRQWSRRARRACGPCARRPRPSESPGRAGHAPLADRDAGGGPRDGNPAGTAAGAHRRNPDVTSQAALGRRRGRRSPPASSVAAIAATTGARRTAGSDLTRSPTASPGGAARPILPSQGDRAAGGISLGDQFFVSTADPPPGRRSRHVVGDLHGHGPPAGPRLDRSHGLTLLGEYRFPDGSLLFLAVVSRSTTPTPTPA